MICILRLNLLPGWTALCGRATDSESDPGFGASALIWVGFWKDQQVDGDWYIYILYIINEHIYIYILYTSVSGVHPGVRIHWDYDDDDGDDDDDYYYYYFYYCKYY